MLIQSSATLPPLPLFVLAFNPGKRFTEPLMLLLVIAAAALLFAWRTAGTRARRSIGVAFAALFLLALCSLGSVTTLLHRAIAVTPAAATARPDVIVVCAGGGIMAAEQNGDSLGEETALRTLSGIAWWKQHRDVPLVMAGADETDHGNDPFTLRLMRQLAIDRGVPPGSILLDTWSINTRQHPIGLARLGFGPRTRVGLVTSDWHLRRATREFQRHFDVVLPHPAARREIAEPAIDGLLPSAGALAMTTVILDEYIGMLWYSISASSSHPAGSPPRA